MQKLAKYLATLLLAGAAVAALSADLACAQAVIVERAMPAPIVEVVPAAPGPGLSWVQGHWVWRGYE